MELDYDNLFDPNSVKIKKEASDVDKIIQYEELLYAISEYLINYRNEKKLTQKKLAKILSVNQTMISKLESGEYNPTFKQIYNISWKLSNSSEILLEILTSISKKIKKITSQEYKTDYKYNEYISYCIDKNNNSNVINLTYKNKIGGNIDNGEYTSSISNAG